MGLRATTTPAWIDTIRATTAFMRARWFLLRIKRASFYAASMMDAPTPPGATVRHGGILFALTGSRHGREWHSAGGEIG
jgi:hypothetical protein